MIALYCLILLGIRLISKEAIVAKGVKTSVSKKEVNTYRIVRSENKCANYSNIFTNGSATSIFLRKE